MVARTSIQDSGFGTRDSGLRDSRTRLAASGESQLSPADVAPVEADMIQSRVEGMRGGACPVLIVELETRVSKAAGEWTMRMPVLCTAVLAYVVVGHPLPAVAQVDQQLAQEYFKEARALCERDGGRLWGVSLCGPMVIADAATGTIATSEPAPAGDRPRALGFVNAPVQWGGITWSAYVWEMIPKDDRGERGRLFMHELFHCIQDRLGWGPMAPIAGPGENSHLDSLEGRYWMRLEWRALARALGASGAARTSAIADALAFRAARHRRFPGAAAREHIVEINEGIATYTQFVTGSEGAQDAIRNAVAGLAGAESGTSFVRTFAYASGAGYGLLLDALTPGWHRKITAESDFGRLLSAAAGVTAAPDAAARLPAMTAPSCALPKSSAIASSRRSSPSCAAATSMGLCSSCREPGAAAAITRAPRSFPAWARSSGPWRTKAHGDFSMRRAARWSRPMKRRYRCRRRSSSMRRR